MEESEFSAEKGGKTTNETGITNPENKKQLEKKKEP